MFFLYIRQFITFILLMKTTQIKTTVLNGKFKAGAWQQAQISINDESSEFKLVKIPQTDTIAEEYKITIKNCDKFLDHVDIYKKRASSNTNNLVNILSAQILSNNMLDNYQGSVARVRSQRIPWRLVHSQYLTIEQGLYIIEGAGKGFYQLSQHYHQPFQVYPNMIGMNIHGTIRVWLNPNFAMNSLFSEYQKLPSFQKMKMSIIKAIEQRLWCKQFPMRNQLLNTSNLYEFSIIASHFLAKSIEQKKILAKYIMKKANYIKMQKVNEKVSNVELRSNRHRSKLQTLQKKSNYSINKSSSNTRSSSVLNPQKRIPNHSIIEKNNKTAETNIIQKDKSRHKIEQYNFKLINNIQHTLPNNYTKDVKKTTEFPKNNLRFSIERQKIQLLEDNTKFTQSEQIKSSINNRNHKKSYSQVKESVSSQKPGYFVRQFQTRLSKLSFNHMTKINHQQDNLKNQTIKRKLSQPKLLWNSQKKLSYSSQTETPLSSQRDYQSKYSTSQPKGQEKKFFHKLIMKTNRLNVIKA